MKNNVKKKLTIFLPLTIVLSAIFHVLNARAGSLQAGGGLYTFGLMWSPGVAALVTQFVTEGNLRGLGWRWGKTRYQLLSIALPYLLISMVYGIVWLTGLGGFPNPAFVEEIASRVDFDVATGQLIFIYILIAATLNLVTSSLPALGEEIGWRGLLVPELYKVTDFTTTSLVSGVIWAVWHYPGILFTDYRSEAPVWYAILCFTVMAIAFSFIMAWMRLKSGSVWTATLLHAAHNVVIQTILTPLTVDTGPTEYIIDEFGAGIAIVYVIVALIFWRMRDRLPAQSAEQAP